MLDSYNLIGNLLFATLFIAYGIIGVVKKQVTFRWRRGIKPSFETSLKGISALIFGIIAIMGGVIMLAPLVYIFLFSGNVSDGVFSITTIAGLIVFFFGLLLSAILQYVLNLSGDQDSQNH